jgi:hypothetical protein
MEDIFKEIKTKVASLMIEQKRLWESTYKDRVATELERQTYLEHANRIDEEIKKTIPESERLTICLTGCAKGDLSHYEIEESLQTKFKAGEGIQYDSEGGQFWVYINPSLVQPVLRHIDYHFPDQIRLHVSVNKYADNPWFQNWTQARKYLETEVGA